MDDDTFIDAFDANYQSEFQDSTVTIECPVLDTNSPPINPSFSDAPFPLQYVRNARVVPDIFRKPHNFQTQISKDKPFRDELSSQKVAKYTFDQLWTEKYRPTRISDLVGNEQAILELVKWVSEWKAYFESSSKSKIPDSNIVLISGPPGIGKTTLATVAVKNANFFPITINASDERSSDAFASQMSGSANSKLCFSNQKPFFILDEIDGAFEPGIINLLLTLSKKKSEQAEADDEKAEIEPGVKPKRHKKRKLAKVFQPVICICNDSYASCLRTLRQNATLIPMKKAYFPEVVKRLEFVCRREKISYETKALVSLAELYDGDIRSCLNCLQLASASSKKYTFSQFESAVSSHKDMNQSVYSLLGQIFYKDPKSKHTLRELYNSLVQLGEEEKIVKGCFENYLRESFVDISLEKTCTISEFLHFFDLIEMAIQKQQNFSLMPYTHLAPCFFHYQCSSYNKQIPIKYPKVDYEMQMIQNNCKEILSSFKGSSVFTSRASLRKEIIPYSIFIIDPSFRFSNYSVLKLHEKKLLEEVVVKMKGIGITYVQRKVSSSTYKFLLEPPIDKLIIPNSNTKFMFLLDEAKGYHIKQMIANDICNLQLKKPKAPVKQENQLKSMFAIGDTKQQQQSKNQSISQNEHQQVWYKYQEGFSNAVKRTLKIKDIFNL